MDPGTATGGIGQDTSVEKGEADPESHPGREHGGDARKGGQSVEPGRSAEADGRPSDRAVDGSSAEESQVEADGRAEQRTVDEAVDGAVLEPVEGPDERWPPRSAAASAAYSVWSGCSSTRTSTPAGTSTQPPRTVFP